MGLLAVERLLDWAAISSRCRLAAARPVGRGFP